MAYKVYHYYSSSWVDISSYVLTGIRVPYADRERNYEPKATGISFEVSWLYSNGINNGDDIKIEDGSSNVVYSGYTAKARKDYDSRVINVEVNNYLLQLTEKNITYDNLYTRITDDGANFTNGVTFTVSNEGQQDFIVNNGHGLLDFDIVMFNNDSNNGNAKAYTVYFVDKFDNNKFEICSDSGLLNPIQFGDFPAGTKYITATDIDTTKFFEDFGCQVLNLVKLMFEHCGLTLNITGMSSSEVAVWNTPSYTMHLDDFTIRFDDLWRINQGDATINNDLLITYWQFIQKVLAATTTVVECTGAKTYQLKRGLSESFTNSNSDYWSYSEDKIEAEYEGVRFELREDGNEIDSVDTGSGRIDWYENLIFYHKQPDEAESAGKWLPTQLDSLGDDVALINYKRALTESYTEKKYKINRITTSSAVVQNMVNISANEPVSEVTEESYV